MHIHRTSADKHLDLIDLRADRPGAPFGPEREWWANGERVVIGVDEAGRGPLAGPVVAGAVAFNSGVLLEGIGDSKTLASKRREELFDQIQDTSLAWAVAEADPATIDRINILQATRQAMLDAARQVAESLDCANPVLLVDGRIPLFNWGRHFNLVKGDSLSFSIGAASILAKVHRDRLMVRYDDEFPGYGFARHKGYPTAEHQAALRRLGCCPIHRQEFTIGDGNGGRVRLGNLRAIRKRRR